MKKQVEKEHYEFLSYLDKARWNSYYHQIEEVLKSDSKSALIIGKGDGIVPNILREQIKEIKVFDIAEDLQPDYLGNILELDSIVNREFDAVVCCQVLEHLPFKYFEFCIKNIEKKVKKRCIISLPQQNFVVSIAMKIPKFKEKKIKFFIPKLYKKFEFNREGNNEHYWVLNVKKYSIGRIRRILLKYFNLIDEYTVNENLSHRFFILEKKK